MALTEEQKQLLLGQLDALDELDEEKKEERRPIFKLEFNLGKTKPKNSDQPSSDNDPSEVQNHE